MRTNNALKSAAGPFSDVASLSVCVCARWRWCLARSGGSTERGGRPGDKSLARRRRRRTFWSSSSFPLCARIEREGDHYQGEREEREGRREREQSLQLEAVTAREWQRQRALLSHLALSPPSLCWRHTHTHTGRLCVCVTSSCKAWSPCKKLMRRQTGRGRCCRCCTLSPSLLSRSRVSRNALLISCAGTLNVYSTHTCVCGGQVDKNLLIPQK